MADRPSETGQKEKKSPKLKKELGLWDIYCISTGSMFSSGFFLLPGLATAGAGPSTVLAYLIAGCLMVPSMLGILELSTALPRAGGPYYFLDRSLGPAFGTITGIGSWLALVFKSAFALVGMGAYLMAAPCLTTYLFHDNTGSIWFIKLFAVMLTVVFVGFNISGAKESTFLQKVLVAMLLGVLGLFILQGFWYILGSMSPEQLLEQFTPFLHEQNGIPGLISTVGLVFISYAGLTHVTSVSEEVKEPERNLPLGVILSLGTVMVVYVLGVFILIAVIDPESLRGDLAPVANAADTISEWVPGTAGMILIIIAAGAAFASTGNAGILSASRYPLAMARDKIVPANLEKLGRFNTPTRAILMTGITMIVMILLLSTEVLAKLGSSFNLLVFGMINLAVIVMRESRIASYDPGFKVPFYPYIPIAGVLISGWLIFEMGWLTTLLSIVVIILGIIWYFRYARPRVDRYGAIHYVFDRLGRYRHPGLQTEFQEILKEKGLREDDPYDQIVERADIMDFTPDNKSFSDVVSQAAGSLARRVPLDAEFIASRLIETGRYSGVPISKGIALLHFRDPEIKHSEMVITRAHSGTCVFLPPDDPSQPAINSCEVYGIIVLVSPEEKPAQHLRIMAELAGRAENPSFVDALRRIENPQKLKEVLLRDTRFLELFIGAEETTMPLVGRKIREIDIPPGGFVAMLRRGEESFEPIGETELKKGDHLTFIGEPSAIEKLFERYVNPGQIV